LTFLLKR
jgi:hypothetical protein